MVALISGARGGERGRGSLGWAWMDGLVLEGGSEIDGGMDVIGISVVPSIERVFY